MGGIDGFFLVILAIEWVGASFMVARAATERGRNSGNWFRLALLFGPPMAALCLIASPPKK